MVARVKKIIRKTALDTIVTNKTPFYEKINYLYFFKVPL